MEYKFSVNEALEAAVGRYMEASEYPDARNVLAILGIGAKKKEEKEVYKVGDIITFDLLNGEKMEAMAVKQEGNGMIFCSTKCLKEGHCMNEDNTNEGGYILSDMRAYLMHTVYNLFPEHIKSKMLQFHDGGFVRIPTEKEIFGENKYGEEESCEQWEPMKKCRNRVAGKCNEEHTTWYWLQNPVEGSASTFALAHSIGLASSYGASSVYGVRPVFCIGI